jgi:hypothetical protein
VCANRPFAGFDLGSKVDIGHSAVLSELCKDGSVNLGNSWHALVLEKGVFESIPVVIQPHGAVL